jgi:hypothetical protein
MHFENIEALIDGEGDITIGSVASIPCVATAADHHQCLAMLVRRPGESLQDLLQRLDSAIASAYEEENYIDEVNAPAAPAAPLKRRTAKKKRTAKSRR